MNESKGGFDHNYYYIYIYSRSLNIRGKKRRAKCSPLYLGAEVNGKNKETHRMSCVYE